MNVTVLAGGKGTRLGYDGQKCCIPVAGRPFLLHRLDQLVRNGATNLHLLVSHASEEVFSVIGQWEDKTPINFIYDEGIGPWEAVRNAVDYIPSKFFHVANGDTYLETPLKPWASSNAVPMMVVTQNSSVPMNLRGGWLDAGLYRVSRNNPTPDFWFRRETTARAYTINTREQLEETDAALRGLCQSISD